MNKKGLVQDSLADVNIIVGVIGRAKDGSIQPTSLRFRLDVEMSEIEKFLAIVTTAPGVVEVEYPEGWKE